jgi:hypothetical protein
MSAQDDYVAGDVNVIDDQDFDEEFSTVVEAPTAVAALEFIAKSLADEPGEVRVAVSEKSGKVVLALSLASDDIGRVIGRRGRTAQALRALVAAAGTRDGVTTSVDILD